MSWIIGSHASLAALKSETRDIKRLILLEGRLDTTSKMLIDLAKQKQIPVTTLSRQALSQLIGHDKHQGMAVEVSASIPVGNENDLNTLLDKHPQPMVLILDGVQDPHNLGACLRTADATGVTAIIAPKDNAVGINATVAKVASGAAESVPFFMVTNLARTMEQLKSRGIWLYGLSDAAKADFYQGSFTGAIGLVLGAEGKGLRQLTEKNCDALYHLPMLGQVSSLNVSVAAGVVLYEALRQRRRNP